MKVTLLVPTLNEYEAMTKVMPLVDKKWIDQILIVDGASTVKTVEWSKAQRYDVYVQKAPGLRSAYRESLDYVKDDVIPDDKPARLAGTRKFQVTRWGMGFFYQILCEVSSRKHGHLSSKKSNKRKVSFHVAG